LCVLRPPLDGTKRWGDVLFQRLTRKQQVPKSQEVAIDPGGRRRIGETRFSFEKPGNGVC